MPLPTFGIVAMGVDSGTNKKRNTTRATLSSEAPAVSAKNGVCFET